MFCIIPLAGPDFIMQDGAIRPLLKVDNECLLIKTIKTRPWIQSGELKTENMIFVLRETQKTIGFVEFLRDTYQNCKITIISNLTKGALLSSIAGVSLINDYKKPVCIDLVDILYTTDFSPVECFENKNIHGAIPYFISNEPCYSYLKIENDNVIETAEKKVISNNASAGTYFFRDLPTFLEATSIALLMNDKLNHKGLQFLCPVYNSLALKSKVVRPIKVTNVQSFSKSFHVENSI